ncbi:TPA: hypothetical protein U2L31_007879, partial [Burkholderia contaminans]|nr:hypothetical protein [Burkholderia contaminans]
MQPSWLFLRGFAGILSGCGKSQITLDLSVIPEWATLVALVGMTGQGKTTVLDNLHPYRLMPSRCVGLRPTSFSYWDEIAEPLAQKQLDWSHDGVTYRSDLVFRVTGKTRTQQAFLHRKDGDNWVPVVLLDGTTADGSAAVYDRCIEVILGRPEVFFTTHFAAQRRKLLGDYEHADVKSLLSAWLGHDELLRDSATAGEVANLLRDTLADVQARIRDGAEIRAAAATAREEARRLVGETQVQEAALARAEHGLQQARARIVQLESEAAGALQAEAQRKQLLDLIESESHRATARVSELRGVAAKQVASHQQREAEAEVAIQTLQNEISDAEARLLVIDSRIAEEKVVRDAVGQVGPLQSRRVELTGRLDGIRQQVVSLRPYRTKAMGLSVDLAKVATEGKSAGERIAHLKTVAGLADRVPCAGQNLAARCELLKDARDARERLTEVSVILANHRRQYAAINSELRAAGVEVGKLDALESQDATVVHDLEAVIRSLDRIAPVASRSQLVDDAKASRAGIVQFLNSRKSSLNNLVARRPVTKAEIESVTKSLEASIEQVQQACQRSVAGYQAHLLKLPASADASVRESAEKALSEAQAQVHRVGHEIARLRSESLKVHERIGRADAGVAELGPLQHAADRLGQEIEN